MRRRVKLVGFFAELGAPLGHQHGVGDVQRQRGDGNARKPHVKLHRQNGQHQRHLDQRGHNGIQRIRDQRFDTAYPALNVARHAAGLPLQVKAQAQGVQVLKRFQRNGARRALRGLGKHQLAQLGKQGC